VATPVTAVMIAVAPTGARGAVYLAGLAAVSATSIAGGSLGRRGEGGALTAAMLGLWLGVTAAVLFFWTLVALVL
jgi:hypothetical protein